MVYEAPTLVPLGLAGGQGKTTVALMTGRILASYGIPVLFVDADPQASLTAFLGVEPDDRPTLLEILTKTEDKVPVYTAIHPVPENDKLFLIPANNELENANHALAASPISISVLRNRLYQGGERVAEQDRVATNFGIIIVDPPPERSHLALTSLGSGNFWVIPAEANIKGVQSLKRTEELLRSCQPVLPYGELLGVIPFRAQWVGYNPTTTTRESIEVMERLVGQDKMLPHLRESDVYKKAINNQVRPGDLGRSELEYPLTTLIDRLRSSLGSYADLIPSFDQEAVA